MLARVYFSFNLHFIDEKAERKKEEEDGAPQQSS